MISPEGDISLGSTCYEMPEIVLAMITQRVCTRASEPESDKQANDFGVWMRLCL